jgi:hypothetical protein
MRESAGELVPPARSRRIRHTRVMTPEIQTSRIATVAEAQEVAGLLDQIHREFDTPSPGPTVLTARLQRLLSGPDAVALLAGDPAIRRWRC